MDKEIIKLENCLKVMKKCLKIPKVENCVCFSDAFKILILEANELSKNAEQIPIPEIKERVLTLKKEIEEIQKIIALGKKECIGCNPCIAAAVFKNYPERLNSLYLDNEI
jgi:hypothetical protein